MSGYADIIRDAVALADSLTSTVQDTVKHYAWAGETSLDGAQYPSFVERKAIVEKKQRMMRLENGKEVLVQASIFFPRPVPATMKDKFVLSDGTTGPIVNGPNGLMDPDKQAPYYREIWLG